MEDIKKQIGELLRETRKQSGLTQKELGEKMGVGEPTYNKYEGGKQNLTIETLNKVAKAMNLKMKITFHK